MSAAAPADQDLLDAPRLAGSISHTGVAHLHSDDNASSSDQNLTEAFDRDPTMVAAKAGTGSTEASDSDDALESYDELELDPDTMVANARASIDEAFRPASGPNVKSEALDGVARRRTSVPDEHRNGTPDGHRRKSIQIRLEKTHGKGRYTVVADDPELRDILRKGIEREEMATAGKKPRLRFRDLVFTRQFTTFDHRNPASSESPFFGFFTLFWIAMVLIFVQVAMHNWRDHGSILGRNQVINMMFSRDVFVLLFSDGAICAATVEALLLQKIVQKGYISWAKSGWIIQNLWQGVYLATAIWWTWYRDWPWTHTIFITLHSLVFLMKQHSYAFYNGYLSSVHRRRELLKRKLQQVKDVEPTASPTSSPRPSTQLDFATGVDLIPPNGVIADNDKKTRRPSMGPRTSTNLKIEKSDVAGVAKALESGQPLDLTQLDAFEEIIQLEIDELTKELQGKGTSSDNAYPNNLTLRNFVDWTCLPTLVYELEYPRQERINWYYVAEKTTATFGVICVMMVVSQAFLYPPFARTMAMKEAGLSLEQRWREYPFIVSDMLFPLLIEQLLTWYVIWECILNVLAEVTRFADRGFYGDWWNSVSWDQYARDWNRPVHNFLLRHVYHSSISTFHLSRSSATFATFLLSALVHEMVMAILFKKVRGYLFLMQLLQMPLVSLSRTKLLKDRTALGNVVFWFGLFVGPSVLTSLYLII